MLSWGPPSPGRPIFHLPADSRTRSMPQLHRPWGGGGPSTLSMPQLHRPWGASCQQDSSKTCVMRKGPESRVHGSLLTAHLSLPLRLSEQEGPSTSLLRPALPKFTLHVGQAHLLSVARVASQHYKPGPQSESPQSSSVLYEDLPFSYNY